MLAPEQGAVVVLDHVDARAHDTRQLEDGDAGGKSVRCER
jgi:hypothetical protein